MYRQVVISLNPFQLPSRFYFWHLLMFFGSVIVSVQLDLGQQELIDFFHMRSLKLIFK